MEHKAGVYIIDTTKISVDDFIRYDTIASIDAAQSGHKLFVIYKHAKYSLGETFSVPMGLN